MRRCGTSAQLDEGRAVERTSSGAGVCAGGLKPQERVDAKREECKGHRQGGQSVQLEDGRPRDDQELRETERPIPILKGLV